MPLLPPALPGLPHWQNSVSPSCPGQSLTPTSGKGASLLIVQLISGIGGFHGGPQYQACTGVASWVLLTALCPSFVVAWPVLAMAYAPSATPYRRVLAPWVLPFMFFTDCWAICPIILHNPLLCPSESFKICP